LVAAESCLSLTPPNRCGWAAWAQYEFRFPCKRDLKKQGQAGSDAGAPREALYSCMRECGTPADEAGIAAVFFKWNSRCY